jgi:predicted nucleotidyltransferase
MKGNWYNKSLPRIKDVAPLITSVADQLKKVNGIKDIYVWGSYTKNKSNQNFRIKDVDLLLHTNLHSEDLISIDHNIVNANMKEECLVEDGFDPICIKFSKTLTSIEHPVFDYWAISKDNKLLHWGAMFADKNDSDIVKQEAEKYAEDQTGISSKKLKNGSDNTRSNWYISYNRYYTKQLSDMPSGWYQSTETDIRSVLDNAMKI